MYGASGLIDGVVDENDQANTIFNYTASTFFSWILIYPNQNRHDMYIEYCVILCKICNFVKSEGIIILILKETTYFPHTCQFISHGAYYGKVMGHKIFKNYPQANQDFLNNWIKMM